MPIGTRSGKQATSEALEVYVKTIGAPRKFERRQQSVKRAVISNKTATVDVVIGF